jgi:hypothetical protein
MVTDRRQVLEAGAAAAMVGLSGAAFAQETPPGPPRANASTLHDFDFLAGEWRIANRRLKNPWGATPDWDVFDGEATCRSILGGVGSIEELRIPARNFAGMGLRLFDVEGKRWADYWVNARNGILNPPPMWGGFEGGVGAFEADDMDGTTPIKVRGVWDRITPASHRWRQAASRDGGRTWELNWSMDWTRA